MDFEDYIKKGLTIEKLKEEYSQPEDILRIINIFRNKGIDIKPYHANRYWRIYSNTEYCARWIGMPDDDEEIFDIICKYAYEELKESGD